jgi:archaellum biogenesis protein FlaJ (TadC family)
MEAFMHSHETLFFWLMIASVIGFVSSLLLIPWILVLMPSDYFVHTKRKKYLWSHYPPAIRWVLLLVKNMLGLLFVICGIIMLFIPGQGILTILTGIILMDFPYKYDIERQIITHSAVLKYVNRLRKKADRPPIEAVSYPAGGGVA